MWDLRVAHDETLRLAASIEDEALRSRVLAAAEDAHDALAAVSDALPVQAIHGDLTDDNVMGVRGADTRLHPHTLLDPVSYTHLDVYKRQGGILRGIRERATQAAASGH